MGSIVLEPGVKEMLLADTRDFLKSEKVREQLPTSFCVSHTSRTARYDRTRMMQSSALHSENRLTRTVRRSLLDLLAIRYRIPIVHSMLLMSLLFFVINPLLSGTPTAASRSAAGTFCTVCPDLESHPSFTPSLASCSLTSTSCRSPRHG